MISTSLRWIARLLFAAVLLAIAAALLGSLHWQPDVVLSVNGQAVTLPGVAWIAIGAWEGGGERVRVVGRARKTHQVALQQMHLHHGCGPGTLEPFLHLHQRTERERDPGGARKK